MTAQDKPSGGAERFHDHLMRAQRLQEEVLRDGGLAPGQRLLREWQMRRLNASYADYAAIPRYEAAAEFFITDLYGAEDFTERDRDIERVYPLMARFLSEGALESLAQAAELHALTQELDNQLLRVLIGEFGLDPHGEADTLDRETYAAAYRRCDEFERRHRQIAMIVELGGLLEDVVKTPFIFATVRFARTPARAAGFAILQSFIERGLRSFRDMDGATDFLQAVNNRETHILEQIRAGGPIGSWDAEYFHRLGI